ncbi:hypothetical protein ZWY2020_040691 [Hordeum vulgare]|nr:hypothetical protein ZWY2020_040691 [Hordeum vulgare]
MDATPPGCIAAVAPCTGLRPKAKAASWAARVGGRDSVLWLWLWLRAAGASSPGFVLRIPHATGLEDAIRREFVASTKKNLLPC